jgi:tryptophanyl-tRNA synthetase
MEEPKDPDTCTVFGLYKLFADGHQTMEMAARYRAGGYGYGHAKGALFEVMNAHLEPYRNAYLRLRGDEDALEDVLVSGAMKAREVARPILERVRSAVGLGGR